MTYIDEVDECVTNTKNGPSIMFGRVRRLGQYSLAVVGKINAQVHEIILAPARLIDNTLQHRLVDLVGDISQHNLFV